MPEGEEVLDQDANDLESDAVDTTTEDVVDAVEETEAVSEAPVIEKERPVYTMPVGKAQEEKRHAVEKAREEAKAEAAAEIERMKADYEERLAKALPDDRRSKVAKFAEENGLDPNAATGLLDLFKESLPDLSKYDAIVKEKEIEGYKSKVSQDFDEKVLPLIQKDYPGVTPQHIADVKKRVSELAFSKGYNTYPIEDIYRVKQDDFAFKNGFSAEASGGRSSELVDYSKMTDAQEHELADRDPAAYENYLKEMTKKDSRYLD